MTRECLEDIGENEACSKLEGKNGDASQEVRSS